MNLCRMEIQTAKANSHETVGFLDPGLVNEKLISQQIYLKDIEDYVLHTFLKLQHKHYVLLPYNFEYVFSCLVYFISPCTTTTI